jgi:hypothetical protein
MRASAPGQLSKRKASNAPRAINQSQDRPRDLLLVIVGRSVQLRYCSREGCDGLFVMGLCDSRKVARKLNEQALARPRFRQFTPIKPFKEVARFNAENISDLKQSPGRNPIGAGLIFVKLLVGDAHSPGDILLGCADHHPAFANTRRDVAVEEHVSKPEPA